MLERRFVVGFRPGARPLALLAASALLLSTSPLHAQSADHDDVATRFVAGAAEGEDEDSAAADAARWAALTQTSPAVGTALLGGTAFLGTTAGGTAAIGTSTAGSAVTDGATPSGAAASAPASAPPPPPPPPSDDGSTLRTVGYIAGGVGIVGFVLFAVAGVGAKNAHDRLEEDCNAGPCDDPAHQSDIEDGKLLQTAANIGLATGIAGLGLGATFIVLGSRPSDAAPAAATSPTGGMISYRARF